MGMNTHQMRQLADRVFDSDCREATPAWRALLAAADEIDTLRLIVAEMNRRCERVAKVTTDAWVYDLLNDAAWKAEQEVVERGAERPIPGGRLDHRILP